MNQKLKIFELRTTKSTSMPTRNLSEKKECSRMINYINFPIENGQKDDFYAKEINSSLPTLKELTYPEFSSVCN